MAGDTVQVEPPSVEIGKSDKCNTPALVKSLLRNPLPKKPNENMTEFLILMYPVIIRLTQAD